MSHNFSVLRLCDNDYQAPTEDHDHGSCALDVNTNQLWRF